MPKRDNPPRQRPPAAAPASRLMRELAAIRRQLDAETPEQRHERALRRAREQWQSNHVWRNRPLAERKRLLAKGDEVQVAYDGAGYGSWYAPEGGWRARAWIVARDTLGIEVELLEPLRVGSGIAPPSGDPAAVVLYEQGHRMRFTTGGKHRDLPATTIICLPVGWLPEPWPGTLDE